MKQDEAKRHPLPPRLIETGTENRLLSSGKERIDMRKKDWEKMTVIYMGITIFTALFGAVYEFYSHEVYSLNMIYAFALPLILGTLPGLLFTVSSRPARIPAYGAGFWNAGVAALTVGSLFQGVLEIYGTTNRFVIIYPAVGGVLLFFGVVSSLRYAAGGSRQVSGQE